MADLSDIEQVLAATVAQAIYPNGTAQPSVAGCDCAIHRSWPSPAALTGALKAGRMIVAVSPLGVERNTTRHAPSWRKISPPPPTLFASVVDNVVTFSGVPSSPSNVALVYDDGSVVYPVQPGDSLVQVATGLAALISGASSSGAVLTVPGQDAEVRIGGTSSLIRELKRQLHQMQITLFASTPVARDLVGKAVDPALASIDWLQLPDGSKGRLLYCFSNVDDSDQKEVCYRRTLVYSVEYPTTQTIAATEIVMPVLVASTTLDE